MSKRTGGVEVCNLCRSWQGCEGEIGFMDVAVPPRTAGAASMSGLVAELSTACHSEPEWRIDHARSVWSHFPCDFEPFSGAPSSCRSSLEAPFVWHERHVEEGNGSALQAVLGAANAAFCAFREQARSTRRLSEPKALATRSRTVKSGHSRHLPSSVSLLRNGGHRQEAVVPNWQTALKDAIARRSGDAGPCVHVSECAMPHSADALSGDAATAAVRHSQQGQNRGGARECRGNGRRQENQPLRLPAFALVLLRCHCFINSRSTCQRNPACSRFVRLDRSV